ncbi:MAG: archaellin/type IV pilin N-terminal domain-containing protein [Candidatus Bathyarchaeia archaeon]
MLKSRKALSPVVASIILIAVTVAVSLAVAVWMGGLAFTFTKTEELKITGADWVAPSGGSKYVNISVSNTGASAVSVSKVYIDNVQYSVAGYSGFTYDSSTGSYTLAKGASGVLKVTFPWSSNQKYTIALQTTTGNKYEYTTTAVP